MARHRNIALVLYSIMLLGYLILGFVLWVMSHAFTACASGTSADGFWNCPMVILLFFGAPLSLGLIPIIALKVFGPISRTVLWVYSVLIAVLLFPLGTVVGVHTLSLLRQTGRQSAK